MASDAEFKAVRDALLARLQERARDPFPHFLRTWALTILPFGLALAVLYQYPQAPAAWILTAVVAGFTQNALGILMHEGSHYFFHRSKPANNVLANLLVCLPIFNTVEGYRRTHLDHHQDSGSREDPYYGLYASYPARWDLVRGLLMDLLGITAVLSFLLRYGRAKDGKPTKQPRYALPAFLLIHAALAALLFAITGAWYAYLPLWLAPLVTIPIAINRLRTVVEHYPGSAGGGINRTTLTTRLEYVCIAPYGYSHHLEHHVWPHIPYYDLAFAHAFLLQQGLRFTDNDVNAGGYLRTFRRLVSEMGSEAAGHEA